MKLRFYDNILYEMTVYNVMFYHNQVQYGRNKENHFFFIKKLDFKSVKKLDFKSGEQM